jgi:hypothetical protein
MINFVILWIFYTKIQFHIAHTSKKVHSIYVYNLGFIKKFMKTLIFYLHIFFAYFCAMLHF